MNRRTRVRPVSAWICKEKKMSISYTLDQKSYEIGMINSFIEIVACGVKPLAISPPIEPENLPLMEEVSRELSEGFGTKYCVVESLMITDIQSAEFTKGKNSILYYKDDKVIERYHEMDRQIAELTAAGKYCGKIRRDLSIEFGRMLGYPMDVVLHKVDSEVRIDPIVL